jgi:acyl-CoA synthetase (AMP-forming)/AMP-acid ligase II
MFQFMLPSRAKSMNPVDEGQRGDLRFGTIPRLVRAAAREYGTAPAVVDGDVTLAFVELEAAAGRAARSLLALGVAHGDRVAIWAPNGWRWIVAALAAHSVGAAIVPINTRYKGDEAAYVLGKSGACVLFTTTDFLGTDYVAAIAGARATLASLVHVIVTDGPARAKTQTWSAFDALADSIPVMESEARAAAVTSSDVCDIVFTSGTTGRPKGAMSTHAQTLRAFNDWSAIVGLRAGDRYLVALPFFHTFGYKAGWLACLIMGATAYPLAAFDRIERDAITVLPGPPAFFQSMLARADLPTRKLSSLRLSVTGAAAIPVDLVNRMRVEIGFQTVLTGYGLTEGNGVATLCRDGDDAETVATTSGRAIPDVEVLVVDDAGNEVPRGSSGELVIGGYTVMTGYFDDPDASGEAVDAQGRLRTGDIGEMDARGYIKITDRKKDMFIVGGFNAYPAEIESVLSSHASVGRVAVVGAPDERLGEVGVAFVVPREGATIDGAALIAWSRERMANYKVPRRIVVVDALPSNATGKVLKYKLRELARQTA